MVQEPKKSKKIIPVAVAASCFAATLFFAATPNNTVTAYDAAVRVQTGQGTAIALEDAFIRVAETVGPATVSVAARAPEPRRRPASKDSQNEMEDELFEDIIGEIPAVQQPRSARATGSGVIVRADGYILTNDHIVEEGDGKEVDVTLQDGTVYRGRVFRDTRTDLAIVKIEPEKPLPFVKFADSGQIKVGQWAIAIGSPFGQQNSMTTGIVSALHRKKSIFDAGTGRYYPDLIQTDASINPGNSGGPLLNIRGEVIGINVAIFSPTGTSAGIGYAIPANTARRVMEQLIANGKVTRGWLGVNLSDVPPGLRKRLGVSKGAYITQVEGGTPAQKAGIRPDDVVVRIESQEIADEAQFREAVASRPPGSRLAMTVLRGGKTQVVTTRIGTPPDEDDTPVTRPTTTVVASRPTPAQTPATLGFDPRPLNGQEKQMISEQGGTKPAAGLLVTKVLPGSIASEAGLRRGSVITAINGKPVQTVEGLTQALKGSQSGETITLQVVLPTSPQTLSEAVVNISLP
ncbi:MAG: DegQ family serine endoprotease [Armatimonadaceae bacterium]